MGSVGSGKTSLLMSILNEMRILEPNGSHDSKVCLQLFPTLYVSSCLWVTLPLCLCVILSMCHSTTFSICHLVHVSLYHLAYESPCYSDSMTRATGENRLLVWYWSRITAALDTARNSQREYSHGQVFWLVSLPSSCGSQRPCWWPQGACITAII